MEKNDIDRALVAEVIDQVSKMPMEDVKADLEMMEAEEVAEKLKIGRSSVYHFIGQGKLPAWKLGSAVRIRPRSLLSFILVKEKMGYAA